MPDADSTNAEYRKLPAVDAPLREPAIALLAVEHGLEQVTAAIRSLLADARQKIAQGLVAPPRAGSRHDHARALLRRLTGAADARVVSNNAAAVYLALTALCRAREVLPQRSLVYCPAHGGAPNKPIESTPSGVGRMRAVRSPRAAHVHQVGPRALAYRARFAGCRTQTCAVLTRSIISECARSSGPFFSRLTA